MRSLLVVSVLLFISPEVLPQEDDYTLTAEAGAGYSYYMTDLEFEGLNRNGIAGTLRFMWNPEHLLSIGLETGYEYLYSVPSENIVNEFGTSSLSFSMTAIPIYISIAMKVTDRIKLIGGSGTYLLYNHGEMFGDEISSSLISIGMRAGVSYNWNISKDLAAGTEIKYSYISKFEDQNISIQFIFIYDLLRW